LRGLTASRPVVDEGALPFSDGDDNDRDALVFTVAYQADRIGFCIP